MFDFCERLDPGTVNRTAIESLVKAGAFDTLGARRSQVFAAIDRALQSGAAAAADRRSGQRGLFDDVDEPAEADAASLPDLPEWEEKEKLAKEKEVLGFYLTSHPLDRASRHARGLLLAHHRGRRRTGTSHRSDARRHVVGPRSETLEARRTGPAHPLRHVRPGRHRRHRCAASAGPNSSSSTKQLIKPDAIVVVRGAVDKRPGSEEANLIVNEIIPLADLAARYTRGVMIRVSEAAARPAKTRTTPRNPPRLPRQDRTATDDLPGRRPQSLLQMLRPFAGNQPRNAHPRRRPPRPRQLPADNRHADGGH